MNQRELLFAILRCALLGVSYIGSLSSEQFKKVMILAEQQTVFGLVFNALNNTNIEGINDKAPLFKAIGTLEYIKQKNIHINMELADFANLCKKNELNYIAVKGQTIACLYHKPELRQPGDIDFLIAYNARKDKRPNTAPFISTLGVNIPEMVEGEVTFERNGVQYELHSNLRTWSKNKHQEAWDELIEKEWNDKYYVEIQGVKVRTLSPTLNAAYVFIHLFFHFIREGVSLRQFYDWAIVLLKNKNEIDHKKLQEILTRLDIYDAYRVFGTILVDKFGITHTELAVPVKNEDRKWQHKILDDIFKGGNFGKLNHHAKNSWGFKMETMMMAMRNTLKYYKLCPSEVGGLVPRLAKENIKIIMS